MVAQIIFIFIGSIFGTVLTFLYFRGKTLSIQTELRLKDKELETKDSLLEEAKNNEQKIREEAKLSESKIKDILTQATNEALVGSAQKVNRESEKQLKDLISPFEKQLGEFNRRLIETNEKRAEDSATLKEKIKQLTDLNSAVSEEARRLTNALKGETQVRGRWGEMILEGLLERSGLRKGIHYETQAQTENVRPDVILIMPHGRKAIIDSKVSLIHYEKIFSAESPDEISKLQTLHAQSVKSRIDELAKKDYPAKVGNGSFETVFMFIPIEFAFFEAIQKNPDLYNYAYDKNVILLIPSTLLATLRLIESMWQQDNQNRNALEIAESAGKLYDKFVGFVNDVEDIGKSLKTTRNYWGEAMKKLKDGRGNLIRQAENMKELGAKAKKQLPTPEED